MKKVFSIIMAVLLTASVVLSSLILYRIVVNCPDDTQDNSCETEEDLHVYLQTYLTDGYYEKAVQSTTNDSERAALNDSYAEIWKGYVGVYCIKLQDYYKEKLDRTMLNIVLASQVDWVEYYEDQTTYYSKFLTATYGEDEDAIAVLQSEYNMKLYRDRAIELYQMCSKLGIEVRRL